MQHGLLSREVLLPDEDETALVELGKRLRAHLRPGGDLEVLLVDRIVTAAWRLRRLLHVEVGICEWERYDTFNMQKRGLGLAFTRKTPITRMPSRSSAATRLPSSAACTRPCTNSNACTPLVLGNPSPRR
jgi:hypothetical protein